MCEEEGVKEREKKRGKRGGSDSSALRRTKPNKHTSRKKRVRALHDANSKSIGREFEFELRPWSNVGDSPRRLQAPCKFAPSEQNRFFLMDRLYSAEQINVPQDLPAILKGKISPCCYRELHFEIKN